MADEVEVLAGRRGRTQLAEVTPVVDLDELGASTARVDRVHVADPIARYVVELLTATRTHRECDSARRPAAGVALIGLAAGHGSDARPQLRRARRRHRGHRAALAHRVLVVDGTLEAGRDVVVECLSRLRPPTA